MNITRDDAASRRRGTARAAILASGVLLGAASSACAAEGIASFYGRSEHGGPTASGERFDMHALTAAHRTAPLGSHMRVTNLKNGQSVVVRINDRGPFVRGRIIDLSRAAAERLGFIGSGLTRVSLESVEAGAAEPATTASVPAATRTASAAKPETAKKKSATAATEATPPAAAPRETEEKTRLALVERDAFLVRRSGGSN
ncbi:MAG: septal ring lytic transglycosylase RlpA family protein [Phyllobacteriaceae bacterium]|nr:septal ring lytic transglycosylase RlpA family protein [Phyllobacteriaceae bacterium]